jgi:hypothetical protein
MVHAEQYRMGSGDGNPVGKNKELATGQPDQRPFLVAIGEL